MPDLLSRIRNLRIFQNPGLIWAAILAFALITQTTESICPAASLDQLAPSFTKNMVQPDYLGKDPKKPKIAPDSRLSLDTLIDLALRSHPALRRSWAQVKGSAASVGQALSAYYPQVATNLFANYNDEGQYHDYELWEENKKMGASLGITYLLLDAGGRKNTALAAKKGLNAANQAYNQSVLDLVFEVQKRYFAYVKALQMLAAKEQDLKVARLNRERAKDFFTAGLNSKSAQLQAQAHLSQVKYQMATIRGEVEQTWKGLACLCSLPVSPRHGVKSPPRLDRGLVCKGAKELVRLIKDKNPRLQALKAQISSEEHQVRAAKSRFAPELSLIGSATAQKVMATKRDQASTEENEYQATVGVKVTYDLFNGFSDCYELRQARSRAEAYRERYAESLLGLRQQVESALDSYQAAADQLRASKQYMQDCEANYKVALEFFNHGEGTMFEVTKSLEQLAQAKSERVGAKMDMYTAAASLAHSCGAFERLGAKQAKWQPMD